MLMRKYWPTLFWGMALFTLVLIGYSPLRDTDTFLYLAIAREVLNHGSFPQFDPFIIAENFPFIVHHELGGYMLFYGAERLAGYTGVIVIKIIAVTASFYPTWRVLYQKNRLGDVLHQILAVLSLVIVSFRYSERTMAFGDLFLALVLFLLYRDIRHSNKPERTTSWLLPLVLILWVNSHGSWPLAIIFTLWWTICNWSPRRLRIFFTCCVATFVNPEGWKGVVFPFKLVWEGNSFVQKNIYEFQPTFSKVMIQHFPTWFFAAFLVLALGMVLREAYLQKLQRPSFFLATTALALGLQGVMAIRFMPTAIIGISLMAAALRTHRESKAPLRWQVLATSLVGVLLYFVFSQTLVRDGMKHKIGGGVDGRIFPTETVRALKTLPVEGPTLNSFFMGGYLTWELEGRRKIFIHGFMPYTDFFEKDFFILGHGRSAVDYLTGKYKFDSILIERNTLYAPVINALKDHPLWYLAAEDEATSLYLRKK